MPHPKMVLLQHFWRCDVLVIVIILECSESYWPPFPLVKFIFCFKSNFLRQSNSSLCSLDNLRFTFCGGNQHMTAKLFKLTACEIMT